MHRRKAPVAIGRIESLLEKLAALVASAVTHADQLTLALRLRSRYASAPMPSVSGQQSLKDALAGPERQIIRDSLERNNWNRNETADALGINRTTLYKKMKRLGLEERVGA